MSSSDPLETLLAVRQAAEDAAAEVLAVAIRRRAAAEETQLRVEAELSEARADLRARRRAAPSPGIGTAAQGAERERFWRRVTEAVAARADQAGSHRAGALAEANVAEAAARAAHQGAREARELVQKLFDRAESGRRLIAGRRAEAAVEEQVAARTPARPKNPRA